MLNRNNGEAWKEEEAIENLHVDCMFHVEDKRWRVSFIPSDFNRFQSRNLHREPFPSHFPFLFGFRCSSFVSWVILFFLRLFSCGLGRQPILSHSHSCWDYIAIVCASAFVGRGYLVFKETHWILRDLNPT